MAIQRPADARPVAAHAFRGFNGLIGHEVVAWRAGFVEMRLKVRPELCNANGLLHGGVLMTLLDSASGFACTFNETATARRLSVTLAFTTQFIKAARDGDVLAIEFDQRDELAAFAELDAEIGGLISEDDVAHAAAGLEPNSSAALILWEDLWAAEFASAVRGSGGVVLEGGRIPYELVEAAFAGLPDGV